MLPDGNIADIEDRYLQKPLAGVELAGAKLGTQTAATSIQSAQGTCQAETAISSPYLAE